MGVNVAGLEFLLFARAIGVDFESTVTIGRQANMLPPEDVPGTCDRFVDALRAAGHPAPEALDGVGAAPLQRPGFAEPLFAALGARSTASVDLSGFEGATIVHDMNRPIPVEHHGLHSTVFDGGALEHIFDFPRAIENAMQLVAPGGHLLTIVPMNDQVGHGFYQFGPELYFRTLSEPNGFRLRHLLVQVDGLRRRWLRVTDPQELGHRVELSTVGPADLYVVAERIGEPGLFEVPQQSDYAARWADAATRSSAQRLRPSSGAVRSAKVAVARHGGAVGAFVRRATRAASSGASHPGVAVVQLPQLATADAR